MIVINILCIIQRIRPGAHQTITVQVVLQLAVVKQASYRFDW